MPRVYGLDFHVSLPSPSRITSAGLRVGCRRRRIARRCQEAGDELEDGGELEDGVAGEAPGVGVELQVY
jgi:hypothetical protein